MIELRITAKRITKLQDALRRLTDSLDANQVTELLTIAALAQRQAHFLIIADMPEHTDASSESREHFRKVQGFEVGEAIAHLHDNVLASNPEDLQDVHFRIEWPDIDDEPTITQL